MVPRLFGTHQILRLDTVAVQQACKLILGFPLDTLINWINQIKATNVLCNISGSVNQVNIC